MDSVISSDGAGFAVSRVGLSQHNTASLYSVQTLPDHSYDGAGGHVLHQTGEEGLLGEVGVVVFQMGHRRLENKILTRFNDRGGRNVIKDKAQCALTVGHKRNYILYKTEFFLNTQ